MLEQTEKLTGFDGFCCKIVAEQGFWKLTPAEKAATTNGAGAEGGIKVPDTMYGLDLNEVFRVHDWEYGIGKTKEEKDQADRTMLNNLIRVINTAPGWLNKLLAPLRRRRAITYYEAVYYLGGPAFWEGKNKPEE